MNPTILGVIGPGFLNQVPTLMRAKHGVRAWGVQGVRLKPKVGGWRFEMI